MSPIAWWHAFPTKEKLFWGSTVAGATVIATAFALANGGGPSVVGLIPFADGFATASLVPSFGGEVKPAGNPQIQGSVAKEKEDKLPEPKRKVSARLPAEGKKADLAVARKADRTIRQ